MRNTIFSILTQNGCTVIEFNSSDVRSQSMRIVYHTLRMNQHFISASEQVQMTYKRLSRIFLFFKSFIHSPAYIQLIRYVRGSISIYCTQFWLEIKAAQNMIIFSFGREWKSEKTGLPQRMLDKSVPTKTTKCQRLTDVKGFIS